jgi:hypothetical protein
MTTRDIFLVAVAAAVASGCTFPGHVQTMRLYAGAPRPASATASILWAGNVHVVSVDSIRPPLTGGYVVLPGPHTLTGSYFESRLAGIGRVLRVESKAPKSLSFVAEAGHEYLLQSARTVLEGSADSLTADSWWAMLFDRTSGRCVYPDSSWTRQDPPRCFPPSVPGAPPQRPSP